MLLYKQTNKNMYYLGLITENDIGNKGAVELSKMLKVNSTLSRLDLRCKEERRYIQHNQMDIND